MNITYGGAHSRDNVHHHTWPHVPSTTLAVHTWSDDNHSVCPWTHATHTVTRVSSLTPDRGFPDYRCPSGCATANSMCTSLVCKEGVRVISSPLTEAANSLQLCLYEDAQGVGAAFFSFLLFFESVREECGLQTNISQAPHKRCRNLWKTVLNCTGTHL